MPLSAKTRSVRNVLVLRCTGSIVLGEELRALETALAHGAQQTSSIVLNLAGIERIDSLGLGLLVRFCTHLGRRGGDLRLASSPTPVVRLLQLTCLTKVFKLFPTEEAAVESYNKLGALPKLPAAVGTRVLAVEPSHDLCVFLHSVLSCRGFTVRTTRNIADAQAVLGEEEADVVLIGPGTAQMPQAATASALSSSAPNATILRLPSGLKSLSAEQASSELLNLLSLPCIE